jgi:hypothetical protein
MDRRRSAGVLLLVAVGLHNLEEGLAYPLMRDQIAAALADLRLAWWSPSPAAFGLALTGLTLAVAAMIGWAASGKRTSAKVWALRLTAMVLLANIVLPHLPAAIALGGYAPGVATALIVNLPLATWALIRLRASPQPE